MARRQAPGTKQRVLVVADRLFGRHGVRSVVMQQLVDETLLKHSLAQLSPNYAERYSCTCIGSKSRGQGIRRTTVEHGDRGRLRPDIWQAWHDANDTDRRHRCIRVLRSPSDRQQNPVTQNEVRIKPGILRGNLRRPTPHRSHPPKIVVLPGLREIEGGAFEGQPERDAFTGYFQPLEQWLRGAIVSSAFRARSTATSSMPA